MEHWVDYPEAKRVTGVSETTLRRWAAEGRFPKPVKFGPRLTRWSRTAVETWVREQLAKANGPQPQLAGAM